MRNNWWTKERTSHPFFLCFPLFVAPFCFVEARVGQSWRMQDGIGGVRQIGTRLMWTGRADFNKRRVVMMTLI